MRLRSFAPSNISLNLLHSSPSLPRSRVLSSSAGKCVNTQSTGANSNSSPGIYIPPWASTKSWPIVWVMVVFPPLFAPVRIYTLCSLSKSRSLVTMWSDSSVSNAASLILYTPRAFILYLLLELASLDVPASGWYAEFTTFALENAAPRFCSFSMYSAHLI